ncbi:hypothetical protein MMC30_004598 [Trapelia coarctata]|nr:hypothetical protein [Trapelia coarctata]
MHHHDYHSAIAKPIHHSTSVTLYKWSRGIFGSAPSTDDKAILHNAAIKPACDVHKLQHQEAIKLVEQSTSAYLTKSEETGGLVTDIRCNRTDLPFYVFNEIDAALFAGVLRGNVYLKWAPLLPALFGRTIRAGRSACPRIAIELADHVLARGAPEEILEVLVHQMIHAFLLQCCGHKNHDISGNGHDLRHGLEFSTIAYIFQKRFFPRRDPFSPAEIGCIRDSVYHARSRHLRHTYLQNEAGSSFCCPNGTAISYSSAGKHYEYVKENTLAPKLDLPSQESKDGKKAEK